MYHRLRTISLLTALALVACSNAAASDAVVGDDGASPHEAAQKAAAVQPANLTRTTLRVRNGAAVLSAFSVSGDGADGAVGTMQPGIVERENGRTIADRLINVPPNGHFTTTLGNSGHDAPALVRNADGSVFELYGAASTYAGNHPPEAWACLQAEFCEPFKRASANDVRSSNAANALASSQELLLPTVGISEMSSAVAGDATIMAGQEQPSDRDGEAGTQAYVTYHAGSQSFDTTAGPWRPSDGAPRADGLETISRAPNDDAYADIAIASAGSGAISLTLGGASCTLRVNGGSPQDVARMAIAAFDSMCPALRGRFGATAVAYEPLLKVEPSTIIGITATGDTTALPPASVTCSGIACVPQRGGNAAHDVRGSGLHRHFLFGGVVSSGPYVYYIMDVQQATGSWNGAAHSSYALRLACFRTQAPSGAQWTWTDCAGHHPFTVSPGPLAPDRVTNSPYVIGAPRGGYGGGMTPYVLSNAAAAQPPVGTRTFPVVSAESAALLPDGRVLIVHGCQATSGAYTACYAVLDGRTAQTTRAGLIDLPSSRGSLASIAAATDSKGAAYVAILAGNGSNWGCSAHSACLLTYRFDSVNDRFSRVSSESVNGMATDGFPGTVVADNGRFDAQIKTSIQGSRAALDTISKPIP